MVSASAWSHSCLLLWIEQTSPRRTQLVEDLLRYFGMQAQVVRADMGHLPGGRVTDDFWIVLEQGQTKQAIVVGWLFFTRNAEPPMIWVELIRAGRYFLFPIRLPIGCQLAATCIDHGRSLKLAGFHA